MAANANWNDTKNKIKAKWSTLSDNDIDSLNGNLDQLSSKLQKVYGFPKEQAEREVQEFQSSLNVSSISQGKSRRKDGDTDDKNKDMDEGGTDQQSGTG